MRRCKQLAVAGAVVVAMVGAPAARGEVTPPTSPVVAAEVTTVHAPEPRTVRLQVTSDVTIPCDWNRTATASLDAPGAAVLVPDVAADPAGSRDIPRVYTWGRYPFAAETVDLSGCPFDETIEAGAYTLHVLPLRGALTVTLTLPGLDGAVSVEAPDDTASAVAPLTGRSPLPVTERFSATRPMDGGDFALVTSWHHTNDVVRREELCVSVDGVCDGSYSSTGILSGRSLKVSYSYPTDAGEIGLESETVFVRYNGADVGALGVWVDADLPDWFGVGGGGSSSGGFDPGL